MNTEHGIQVGRIRVRVVRKPIKNLHLGVYPPHGRVRVAAPLAISDNAIRLAVIGKLAWIGRQRAKFQAQPRMSRREFVNGESHYAFGRRYRLRVVEIGAPLPHSIHANPKTLELRVRRGTSLQGRQRVLNHWYRKRLREAAAPFLAKWQDKLAVSVAAWGIKKMKTKWGSCNATTRRVWLNLELAKAAPECIEYVVVHELIHLKVRHHGDRFIQVMETALPGWKARRDLLNSGPLGYTPRTTG